MIANIVGKHREGCTRASITPEGTLVSDGGTEIPCQGLN